jgi:hypothetical protein
LIADQVKVVIPAESGDPVIAGVNVDRPVKPGDDGFKWSSRPRR